VSHPESNGSYTFTVSVRELLDGYMIALL